jgi:hypothetical protein
MKNHQHDKPMALAIHFLVFIRLIRAIRGSFFLFPNEPVQPRIIRIARIIPTECKCFWNRKQEPF